MIAITAEDQNHNKIYILKQTHGWNFYYKNLTSACMSNFTSNAAELYIALENLGEFDSPIDVLKRYAEYLLPETIKYHRQKGD